MTAGAIIREARKRASLTQTELAERLGTTQPVIARWERGGAEPSYSKLVEIVRACGLDLHVSLARRDEDHERLIRDQRRRTPGERLETLLAGLEAERLLQKARRVS